MSGYVDQDTVLITGLFQILLIFPHFVLSCRPDPRGAAGPQQSFWFPMSSNVFDHDRDDFFYERVPTPVPFSNQCIFSDTFYFLLLEAIMLFRGCASFVCVLCFHLACFSEHLIFRCVTNKQSMYVELLLYLSITRTWKPLTAPAQHVLIGYDGRVDEKMRKRLGMICDPSAR